MPDIPAIKAADLQRLGVSKPYAHQLITGARSPSLKLALQIEAALGVPPMAWPLKSGEPGSLHGSEVSVDDPAVVAPAIDRGADNPERNVSRTEVAA